MTDAGAANQGGEGNTRFELSLNSVDLEKSTEMRFGLNHGGSWCFTSYTPLLLVHPLEAYKENGFWASSGTLAILLVHHAF